MKIDQHPFPTTNVNMVVLGGKTKVPMSERARKSGSVDPRVQVLGDEAKGDDHHTHRHEVGQNSEAAPAIE
jgi:hypothetical protein